MDHAFVGVLGELCRELNEGLDERSFMTKLSELRQNRRLGCYAQELRGIKLR